MKHNRTMELLVDALNEHSILEMAITKSKAEAAITALWVPAIRHLMKVVHAPDHRACNAWKKEINVWINDVRDVLNVVPVLRRKQHLERLIVTDLFDQHVVYLQQHRNMVKTSEGINFEPSSDENYEEVLDMLRQISDDLASSDQHSFFKKD